MPKRRKLQQRPPGYIMPVGPGGRNIPTDMSPRSGGRSGGRRIEDIPDNNDIVGAVDEYGNVMSRNPNYQPVPLPTQKPLVQRGKQAVGNIAKEAVTSPEAQDLMRSAAGEAARMAGEAAGNLAKTAAGRAKTALDNRRRKRQPQPQAGGGNNNNNGGNNNMRPGKGNGNGGNGRPRSGGAGGQAYHPNDSWKMGGMSGTQGGPYAAAPSGPRVYIDSPADSTLNKIASIPQKYFGAGDLGKYSVQQLRTQINVINWNDAYKFNIKNSSTGDVITDTVNDVISNVWVDKYSAILQDAIAYKRGTNNDINNILTFDKLTFYHNIGMRAHALIAEINARRNFLPEYEEQNQALSLLKTKLDGDTSLLTAVEELKFKISNVVLSPEVMKLCCWMYQLNKNIPETGSDVSLSMSHYLIKDLLDVNNNSFTETKKEVDELIGLLSAGTATAPALTVVEFQVITQYLRNTRFPYQLMGNHVFGHPQMDYDPVWNGMWDNMALYVNDATEGRYNLFGEYSTTQDLQVAFPMSPSSVPIAATAPLIMNYGKFGNDNDRDMKRSAFPYWGLSVPEDSYVAVNDNNSNKWVLKLNSAADKGVSIGNMTGSANLFSAHIFNFGASAINNYEFKDYAEGDYTPNYLKNRGENTYQYNPSKSSTQDAVKRFFIQMECMQSVVPMNLRS